jgi:hypothetical protein
LHYHPNANFTKPLATFAPIGVKTPQRNLNIYWKKPFQKHVLKTSQEYTCIINDMIGAKICQEIPVLGFLKEAQKAVENV